jgi:uncharacterized protein
MSQEMMPESAPAAAPEKPKLVRALNAAELRVLGTLIEKSLTTPDQYPLSLNATRVGCNQKTSREPISEYDERTVGIALKDLIDLRLVKEVFPPDRGAVKYEHCLGTALDLRAPAVALLAVLMLRGPQTPGELRQNAHRLHAFADVEALIDVLDRLAARNPALLQNLGRSPGQREDRYLQLLGGVSSNMLSAKATRDDAAIAPQTASMAQLQNAMDALSERVSLLEQKLASLNLD